MYTATYIVFDSTHSKTPANIRIYLIFLLTRVISLHFAADGMGLSSLKFLWWAS